MFLGREKELSELCEQFKSNKKTAVLVYGKRRVGKSTLIKEAAKNFDGTVINHLCVKSSYEGKLMLLCRSVSMSLGLPDISFPTIFDLFEFLKKQSAKILLILDEYQYFKESKKDMEVDSFMQTIIDDLPENIKLVFCGSYIAIMKELLQEQNPLFGRFTSVMRIEEFDYFEASQFYPQLPVREKIRFYSVFGGSPYVLSNLDYNKTLEENISNLLIEQNSLLRTYIESIMLREIQKNYDVRILEIIGNGKKKYKEISNFLGTVDTGLLDKQLKNLLNMETLVKIFPINKVDDKKKQFYEIKDNLLRFYFSYIFSKDTLIEKFGKDVFFTNTIEESLNTFISYRFEGIVIQYFKRLAHSGKLTGIEDFGSYWYDDSKSGKNGQFDCVLKEQEGYDFYEVKFYEKPMALNECEKEENQIRSIIGLPCKNIGFICSAGFNFEESKYTLLSADDLYL